jgi:hypothetical protein
MLCKNYALEKVDTSTRDLSLQMTISIKGQAKKGEEKHGLRIVNQVFSRRILFSFDLATLSFSNSICIPVTFLRELVHNFYRSALVTNLSHRCEIESNTNKRKNVTTSKSCMEKRMISSTKKIRIMISIATIYR